MSSTIQKLLIQQDYIVDAIDGKKSSSVNENFEKKSLLLTVCKKINDSLKMPFASISIHDKEIRFYAKDGFIDTSRNFCKSSYLMDKNEQKFVLDFKQFANSLTPDTVCRTHVLIERI